MDSSRLACTCMTGRLSFFLNPVPRFRGRRREGERPGRPPGGLLKIPIILLLFSISLFSCRSISPVSVDASGSLVREKTPTRIKLEDFSPDWRPFAPNETPGLYYTSARFSGKNLEIWAIKAELSNPSLKIVISKGAGNKVSSAFVSSFVRDEGLLAGINTVPFDPVSAKEGEERSCIGIVVSDGVLVSAPVNQYDALIFYKSEVFDDVARPNLRFNPRFSKAAIVPQKEILSFDNIENAVGGFRIILDEGEINRRLLSGAGAGTDLSTAAAVGTGTGTIAAAGTSTSAAVSSGIGGRDPRHPRSAAGLSMDGNTLYLLVIDGRRPGSAGATEAETGFILKRLGAWTGLNFDGGGSSALALRFPDGLVRTVNTPIHGGIPGRERAVAACLGIGILFDIFE